LFLAVHSQRLWLLNVHIEKIISGGQTGVDRAALDFAIARGIPHGGWCPAGRKAADGVLSARYKLIETESAGYRQRTKQNLLMSDVTLIIYCGELVGGSLLTLQLAGRHEKPIVLLNAAGPVMNVSETKSALCGRGIRVLNIAGPSEGRCPGIYEKALTVLLDVWDFHA